MKRISSYRANRTYVLVRIMLILFLFCSLSIIAITGSPKQGVYISLLSLFIIVMPLVYISFTGKEVSLSNEGIKIKSLRKEIFVPTSNLKRVSGGKVGTWWVGGIFRCLDVPIIIEFYERTPFGTRVSFVPIGDDFGPDRVHRTFNELYIMIR